MHVKKEKEEDYDTELQFQACLSDETWADYSNTKGVERLLGEDDSPFYKLQLTKESSHIEIREKEPYRLYRVSCAGGTILTKTIYGNR